MTHASTDCDCLIVGAGITGLTAARRLQEAGHEVVLLEKSSGVGGRMATRRDGEARFDHGVQAFRAGDRRFLGMVEEWLHAGVAKEWCYGFPSPGEHHDGEQGHRPYYCGVDGMNAIPKYVARELTIHLETEVTGLAFEEQHWMVHTAGEQTFRAERVILTCPVPQAERLLRDSSIEMEPEIEEVLSGMVYQSQFSVMAVLDGDSGLPDPGALRLYHESLQWICDNRKKGISPSDFAVTIIAHPRFSRENFYAKPQTVGELLLDIAGEHVKTSVKRFQVHRWLYSKPVELSRRRFLVIRDTPSLMVAGDAFCEVKHTDEFVEGAALSGFSAAAAILGQQSVTA
ncbi:FAD-dependent oxidoreductase [bacterium]|nr:FAD-dependent oxidoreductase [bacterium]